MPAASSATSRWSVACVLLLCLVLSGCTGSSGTTASTATTGGGTSAAGGTPTTGTAHQTAPGTTPPARTPPPAPNPGECRKMTFPDISLLSDSTKTIPCTDPHTAYTFAVRPLPADVAFDGVQIQNDGVQTAAAARCRSAFGAFIGGDAAARALTRLTFTYFVPRQEDFDLGAHWVRCDVVALQSARTLADLPHRIAGLLDSPAALGRYGVCSQGEPGSGNSALVICTQPHAYRALAALRLGAEKSPYPGQGAALGAGRQRCRGLVAKSLGVSGGFTYSWTYPSSDDWSAGQRFGYCWSETST